MQQRGLTVIVEIQPEKVDVLKDLLNGIGTAIDNKTVINLYGLQTVHFLRWVILDKSEVRGEEIEAQLVLSTNYDGKLEPHLLELVEQVGPGFADIYRCCKDFPENVDTSSFVSYLKSHRRRNAAFYIGSVGRSVQQILHEKRVWNRVQTYLQCCNPSQIWDTSKTSQIYQGIQEDIEKSDFHASNEVYQPPFLQRFGVALLGAALLVCFGIWVALWFIAPKLNLIGTSLLLLGLAIWWFSLRRAEEKDRKAFRPMQRNVKQISELNQREDFQVQNQITHLVNIKPGWVRQFSLRFVLWAINLLARTVFNKGSLGGIRSIHFARWAIIDKGKRLLFFSNFDGSWESYLGEFVDRSPIGLTGVWSNTEGFPPTKNLVGDGARSSKEFKSWVRAHQLETQVWFSAYKDLSINNVNQNTEVNQGLQKKLNQKELIVWLEKL